MTKKIFLLDAMALIYRAYFAYQRNPLINSKKQNVSAIFGFTNTLMDLLAKEKPTHLAVVFDSHEPTVRHIEFAAYKAHRDAIPEDIVFSIPIIKKIIEGFNIPVLAVPGFEADDIIGTVAQHAEKNGFITYMMTPDKDFGQLVTEKILLYKPARMGNDVTVMGVKEVCNRYQIRETRQVIDILGLAGDASDNIPGVPGIGEKTAIKLIQQYGSIENLLTKTSELKGKLKENIEKYSDQAILSKRLATIILNVPVLIDEEKLHIPEPDFEALKKLFDDLEFRRTTERLMNRQKPVITPPSAMPGMLPFEDDLPNTAAGAPPLAPKSPNGDLSSPLFGSGGASGGVEDVVSSVSERNTITTIPHQYHLADTPEKRLRLVKELEVQIAFCFDTETTGLDAHNCGLVAIAFSWKPHEAVFVPVPENQQEAKNILDEFQPVFRNEEIGKIGQNIKFDMCVLQQYGISLRGDIFDTMLAHYLIEPSAPHNMNTLAERYLNYSPVPIEALIGKKGKNQGTMRNVPLDRLLEYTCEDADITLQLSILFEKELEKQNLVHLFDQVETKLVYVLTAMENEGIRVDLDVLKIFSKELEEELKRVEKEIFKLAGRSFNIASPKQLGDILYNELKITENPKKTPTGQFSTKEDVLSKLAEGHPIVPIILDIRELQKLKSTYVDVLPELVNPKTGRIHTSYNQAVAVTGRLSSDNPNLQNIPIRTTKGKEVRKAFVARSSEYTLLSADYSQIELRIMAELSGDDAMLEAFRNGLDIHSATAARVYGVPLEEITPEMRRKAKMVNFGIIYGISAFGLSERLHIPRGEAARIISQYFSQYPKVKEYMDRTILSAREKGYVETLLGRKRYLSDIGSQNANIRQNAERTAINTPIQGTAADMIKVAMISIHDELSGKNFKTKMLLQVHDELVFDLFLAEKEAVVPIIEKKMKTALNLKVPVEVDIRTGANWMEAH